MPGKGNGRCVRVLTCGAIMLTVVTGVAGCGGKTNAGGSSAATSPSVTTSNTSAPPSTSASSTVSSTPTAASTGSPALGIKGLPDAAKQKTTDGAIAFVKYYLQVVNRAGTNPSGQRVVATMSLPGCNVCSGWDDSSIDAFSAGTHIVGDQLPAATAYSVAANLLSSQPPQVHVRGQFPEGNFQIVNNTSGSTKVEHNQAINVVFLVEWTEQGWKVAKVQQDATG